MAVSRRPIEPFKRGKRLKLEAGSEVRLVVAENEGDEGPQASTVTAVGKHRIVR